MLTFDLRIIDLSKAPRLSRDTTTMTDRTSGEGQGGHLPMV